MNPVPSHYPARVQAALRYLDAAGVERKASSPPLHRLLWRFGVEVPPPILAGFLPNLLVMGGMFGTVWGFIMWLLVWRSSAMSGAVVLSFCLLGGLLFGSGMAWLMNRQRRRLGLVTWEALPKE